MGGRFFMGDLLWRVCRCASDDPVLVDRTGRLTLATTDPNMLTVYVSDELSGEELNHVLVHEMGHCAFYSFGLLEAIHRMTYPAYWVEAEEWVCNFIADYGMQIFSAAKRVMGDAALDIIPREVERLIA